MKKKVVSEHGSLKPLKMEESAGPLEDNVADILVMINLPHELHEPVKLLRECSGVLKPSGELAIVDWKKKETEHGPPVENDTIQNPAEFLYYFSQRIQLPVIH